jgi:mono/diheme cytochrome c family protein
MASGQVSRARWFNIWGCCLLASLLAAGSQAQAQALDNESGEGSQARFSPEAAAIFNTRCTACHTYGRGIKVGPDLKGVNERRKREWLLKFIHASSIVIKSGDPTARSLFAEFKQQRMPDWIDLSDKQINDILDYIGVGGPDIKPIDERNAQMATAADVERGRKLFYGQEPTKYGAQACVNCHSAEGGGIKGGALGPDLTTVYIRYQDIALTQFLRHPCFRWETHTPEGHYLSPMESFALKAFLRESAMGRAQGISRKETPDGK